MQLRQYQQSAVDETIEEITFGSKNLIIELPTGSGKSLVISELCKRLDGNIVVLVNITSLIDQIAEHLDEVGVDYSILKAGRESEFTSGHRVQLVMSQTLHARLDKINLDCDYIIQDERHKEFNTKRTSSIVNKLKPKSLIGLSATPYDQNGYSLIDIDAHLRPVTVQELQDDGFLSPVKYLVPRWAENIDYSNVKKSGNDYSTSDLDNIINTKTHLELAMKSMNQIDAKNKKTIVFCSSIDQCDNFSRILNENGYKSYSYHSECDSNESEIALEAFKNNYEYKDKCKQKESLFDSSDTSQEPIEIKCLCSVSKLSIGFDVKDIELGVQLRPTKVRSLYIQQIGRLTRIADGKEYAEYLDLGQTLKRFGFHTDDYIPAKIGEQIDRDKEQLEHISLCVDDKEEPTEITHEFYNLKVDEVKQKKLEALKDGKLSIQDLIKSYEMSETINEVIIIGSKLHTMVHGSPISKAGRPYNYNTDWLSELIEPNINKYPTQAKRWLKAYKTRGKNIIKEGGNWNAIRFFIEFLVERHEEESVSIYEEFAKSEDTREYYKNQREELAEDDFSIYEDEEIPF